MRPFRSVLYLPASNSRALQKARSLPADALILDLEDAVAPDEKPEARVQLKDAIAQGGFGARYVIVRINALDTPWGADDIATIGSVSPDAILLPKVDGPAQIADLSSQMDAHPPLGETRIWAMMETPIGILNAAATAAAPRLEGMVMGTNDLAKDLGAAFTPDRLPMQHSLGQCMLAARAHGRIIVDGVYNQFKDEDGLRAECTQGLQMGMDGKTLIHPAQIAVANEVFAPSKAAIAEAHAFVEAFEAAIAEGKAVAVVNGRIVENLHVEAARRTIAKADAIKELETQ